MSKPQDCAGRRWGIISALAIMSAVLSARADVKGIVQKKDGAQMAGMLRWLPSSKVYVVTTDKGIALQVPLAQVAAVKAAPPPELENAVRMVRAGQGGAAILALDKVLKDYAMLEHDITAARWLASAYLQQKDAKKAIEMCSKVMEANPAAVTAGELTEVYWQALLQDGRDATLKKELGRAIESGSRLLAALAQVMRGNMESKNGNFKDALLDGYLRTAVLYRDVKEVQPQALYGAVKCFEQLSQHSHAEKFRKRLLAEFPQDPYSQKLKAGI